MPLPRCGASAVVFAVVRSRRSFRSCSSFEKRRGAPRLPGRTARPGLGRAKGFPSGRRARCLEHAVGAAGLRTLHYDWRRFPFVNVSPCAMVGGTGTYGEPPERVETEGETVPRAAAGGASENSAQGPKTAFPGVVLTRDVRVWEQGRLRRGSRGLRPRACRPGSGAGAVRSLKGAAQRASGATWACERPLPRAPLFGEGARTLRESKAARHAHPPAA